MAEPIRFDVTSIEELRAQAKRRIRALVRDEPVVALGGAFACGFMLGGGWRTRLGRMMMAAAARHLVFEAARQYLDL